MRNYENNIVVFTDSRIRTFFIILTSVLMIRSSVIMITTHVKCRGGLYPRSNIERFPVPDEKVSWSSEYKEYQPHNHTASSKLTYIFKALRDVADKHTIKIVYEALAQSILSYCITTWGGACKTKMITLERAQRMILKVSLSKPRLFPTSKLYEEAQVLTVRQLYIMLSILHKMSDLPEDRRKRIAQTRRKYAVCESIAVNTSFARRFFPYRGAMLLNKVNKIVPFSNHYNKECKSIIYKWIQTLSYSETEKILEPWADPNIGDPGFKPQWNSVDGKVSRISYMGQYKIENGYPLNPIGRTGMSGRGVLGRWGPNHAADPVVTRWKRFENGEIEKDKSSNKPILQCVAVKRRDTGEWALPGGMVDPGEKVSATAVREFQEEAMNSLVLDEDQKQAWFQRFEKFFNEGDVVYKGYIDDHRNTDNAWMESIAYNFHDNNGSIVGALKLHAGDDAVGVRWVDITPDLNLYASHKDIVMAVFDKCLSTFS